MLLREWQEQFQTLVLNEFSAPKAETQEQCEIAFLQEAEEREQRLSIYQNAYHLRLSEALRTNFSALHKLLGDTDFYLAARQFLQQHPPSTTSIRWFGEGFAAWLTHQKPYSEQPAIAELATFEWALRHAIDAADAERAHVNYMTEIPPEKWAELYFSLHPSVNILFFKWNAIAVWHALEKDEAPPAPQPTPTNWLVYREKSLVNAWRSASREEIEALQILVGNNSFGDLCEYIYEQMQDPQQAMLQAATWLKSWIEEGLLVACKKTNNANDH